MVARTAVTSEDDPRNEADLYSEMDEAKARADRAARRTECRMPTTFRATTAASSDWEVALEDRRFFETADPALLSYYPPERIETALAVHRGRPGGTGAVRERRLQGYRNALRFHKMFADAGGHVLPGAKHESAAYPGTA